VARILAEPNIVAVSGRPAQFNSGGEIPVLIPQSLGTTTIEFKKYGTQVDFLPIVLGNGNVRLEVRPRVSSLDPANGIELDGVSVPGFRVREVDTAVEMKAGQTFAIAGLVEEKTESLSRGLPYISDLPIIGVPFRKVEEQVDEVELLILVTPEFVDAMEPHQAPCGGPGLATTSPTTFDLYCSGHLEVPTHVNPIAGMQACGTDCYGPGGCQGSHTMFGPEGMSMPGGVGYEDATGPTPAPAMIVEPGQTGGAMPMLDQSAAPRVRPLPALPEELQLPRGTDDRRNLGLPAGAALRGMSTPIVNRATVNGQTGSLPQNTAPSPYSPPRQPVYMRNAPSPNNPQAADSQTTGPMGLIGPIGYDAQ
jgi:pilus assembly protein CpaC